MSEQAATRLYSHDERMRVVFGVAACILLVAVDQTVVLPAIPQMARNLSGSAHISWVVSAYLLTSTATAPIYGKLSDQFGRGPILLPALVLFLAACAVCALADSVPGLIAGRALQGLGGGALMAVAQAAVTDVVPLRERGRYQAWFAGTWAVASGAGPVLGGLVAGHFSWRWIFWGNLPLGLLALALVARGMKGLVPVGGRGRIDYLGAALLLVTVSALLAALSAGGVDVPWLSAGEAGLMALAVTAGGVLVAQQRLARSPLFPAVLLANGTFRGVLSVGFSLSVALFAAIFLLPMLLQGRYGLSPQAAGLAMTPFLFATVIGAFGAGQVARHSGRVRPPLIAGLSVAGPAFALLAVLPQPGAQALIWLAALAGLGLGAVMPMSLVAAQAQAQRADMGTATGLLLLVRAVGGAFGATLAGAALALTGLGHGFATGFATGFALAALFAAAALVAALRLPDISLPGAGN